MNSYFKARVEKNWDGMGVWSAFEKKSEHICVGHLQLVFIYLCKWLKNSCEKNCDVQPVDRKKTHRHHHIVNAVTKKLREISIKLIRRLNIFDDVICAIESLINSNCSMFVCVLMMTLIYFRDCSVFIKLEIRLHHDWKVKCGICITMKTLCAHLINDNNTIAF